ncbi:serine/threonine-protein kinase [Anaerobacterium chartisolvens]|uniref:non-specific serine/threonine protein kinase n=1 Tax=Anaerobacterium chartisolvens TaxID=1297424 RepID=A0A369B635_9FIRM|nr:Stk1 family PASTA domain-containing Ser/Thr kinase [Anaerobacterium chartisolvens]RCX16785.1 serine/threonine-protein kinase [Anaerobacterium chartisolvens]
MQGQILGNRYELIEKIGGGGMALVYKARCQLLNRYVAVKILRPEFTNDEEFVKRFRIEAQSAASLSHPNIVSIYDVGHDDNVHYIIMEYVDGITLKDYISRKGPLDWKEAVNITIQICSAIENAHRNHIVHRDIKPHNILLTMDGIAKVTDFGIARAVSSSTITMVGSTIGSVHYFSPEQARGGFTDEKSDLYSLGIALYEMVTGKVPFDAETPVAIALKHIQDQPVPPFEINPGIPTGVNDIIIKAIKKDQNKRYPTATEFLQDLYRVLKEPYGEFLTEDESESSQTRRIKAVNPANHERKGDYLIKEAKNTQKGKKNDRLTYWAAAITAVVIIVIFSIVGYTVVLPAITGQSEKDNFIMENYVNREITEVKAILNKAGFEKIDIKEEYDSKVKEGIITKQSIPEGTPLKPEGYSPIEFTVSKGPELIKIPDYRGKDPREARTELRTFGLETADEWENSEGIAEGSVIRTEPKANEEVLPGTTVTLFISKGPQIKLTKVPSIIGLTQKEATQRLLEANLKVGKTFPEDISTAVDKVEDQKPAADTEIQEGTAVDIYFKVDTTEKPKEIKYTLNLTDSEQYGDTIKVLVEITPSDTNIPEIIYDEEKGKAEFPFNVPIRIPAGGYTKVRIYLDGEPYLTEFTLP